MKNAFCLVSGLKNTIFQIFFCGRQSARGSDSNNVYRSKIDQKLTEIQALKICDLCVVRVYA